MLKKIFNYLAIYSNGLLILLIVLSFLALITVTSRSRRETLAKIIQLNAILVRDDSDSSEWLQVRYILDGVKAGAAGRDLAIAATAYELELGRFVLPGQEMVPSRSGLRNSLGDIIQAYTNLLRQRESAFDSLYSFLVVGVFIQSFALMINLGRVGTARAEIKHRDTMLAVVQKVREDERHHLASYLHDSILQDLGGLGLHPALRDAPDAHASLRESIEKIRRLTYGLAPLHLDQAGLVASLRELTGEHARHGGIPVDFVELGYNDGMVDSGTRLILYRGVQEGLANIRKYASAGKVDLRLIVSHPYLILTLRDDGCGFDPKTVCPASGGTSTGFGLALLARQVQRLGGDLLIESSPGFGTKLQIRLDPTKATI